jgi:16S rRNA (cytosine1402-N4)-methyltransferase
MTFSHVSVLAEEVVGHLPERQGFVFADLTLGGGGHAERVFNARPDISLYIGVDRDPVAIAAATARLQPFSQRLRTINARFSEAILELPLVDGLLADLGVSSPQLDEAERGFSFMRAGPLDMRMGNGPTLAEYLHDVEEEELARVIYTYGEERFSRRVARAIIEHRASLKTTIELADLVRKSMPKTEHRIDPATRTFQALRIAVNDELGELETLLKQLPSVLGDAGVAMIISFHSLEDRAVKEAFRAHAQGCICPPKLPVCVCGKKPLLEVVTKKPLTASEAECNDNPRARSAKLRIARRVVRAAA